MIGRLFLSGGFLLRNSTNKSIESIPINLYYIPSRNKLSNIKIDLE